jgi:phage N-6-adenine-methyltransferase
MSTPIKSPHDLWPSETQAGSMQWVDTPYGRQATFVPGDELGYKAPEGVPAYVASSNTPEWYTPQWLLQEVYSVLGEVDLDPAAPLPPYTQWVKARQYYTEADGKSLGVVWRGKVYLNPPYGRKIGVWVAKLAEHYKLKYVSEAILLVPARTDTQWFTDVWAADCLCFIMGRLKFEGPSQGKNTATFPSVVAYYGSQWVRFAKAFSRIGHIIDPRAAREIGR